MPADHSHAPLAADLLAQLRAIAQRCPEHDPPDLSPVLEALLIFGDKRKLFGPSAPKLTKKMLNAAGALLEKLLKAPQPGDDRRASELLYDLAAIHISGDLSFYAFPAPYERTYNNRTTIGVGLTTVDSDGKSYPTLRLGRHLRQDVGDTERDATRCAPHLLTAPPATLLSSKGCEQAIERLRTDFPAGLPFRDPLHERRFRVWCLMTYLFPLVPTTPFLRVRVPDIRSARNVQHLLEACCFNALGVFRRGQKAAIRRHRDTLAGTTIFSPQVRTGRLPAAALDLLEAPPRSKRFEPPVAYIEIWDDSAPPRVPEDWIMDVELAGQVGPTPLPEDHRHLGCAVALFDGASLIRMAPADKDAAGLARWMQKLLYGDVLSDAELASAAEATQQAESFVMHQSELAELAMQVWVSCLQETADKDDKSAPAAKRLSRCNPACLRQRILERWPQSKSLLEGEGWHQHFTRRLLEQNVVTYTLKNLTGCLSPIKSVEWQQRFTRGVEVPAHRLPPGADALMPNTPSFFEKTA
jgi:hypothetical protein